MDEIKQYFGKIGAIAFAKFTYKGQAVKKASIEFEKEASVKKAIDSLNGKTLSNNKLEVQPFIFKEKQQKENTPTMKPRSPEKDGPREKFVKKPEPSVKK